MKYVSILGSTGSIGTQTLEIVTDNPDKLKVVGLTTNENIDLLEKQIKIFQPKVVAVMNPDKAYELQKRLGKRIEVLSGLNGLCDVASLYDADITLTAVPGMVGLLPTLEAIDKRKDIALANKETLVSGGHIVMEKAREKNIKIYPVDSEHSAIFQCLMGNREKDIHKIILTASGGPFRGKSLTELKDVTVEKALKHPNWSMGKKVTIDSATLMNKGLEVIEAKWLFELDPEQIEVVVHPQSIIHSLVEYVDHSTLAQLGYPDMKIPIQLAMFYPARINNKIKSLNLAEIGSLTFEKPNTEAFRCLALAFESIKLGGSMPTVLNAANEIVVENFLKKKIDFIQIPQIVERVMEKHDIIYNLDLDKLLQIDEWARATASTIC
ncbi:1-deoxy-D-xylulose-5-phosphate reductoisomerase [Alkalibaculum sp. M08DMB]|uniref:1-deoxy-D-xylulose 5-phosphate reductoisomerase n=2 Tax=Alkalibaculum sporogenes TaxID=2655001 RepID=A0A6A7K8I2_9FIRM|nr:1-deoxy-D-xylulose-5-phosphate reductoisomerase [Alkalibaculum sporogenes]MPW25702.1 1-deoxy-D-xylulose-5-phosphate reductoisomerase [Alkalibaculum sporogenes]